MTAQATVGGTTVDCIMVYISANEVGAILPSSTPTGTGTLTINNNGQTATAPITVVPAAFGIFTQSQTGSGAAEAFNLSPDGTSTLNTLLAPASTGQTMMLNGTGLGAIASDETQSGVTDAAATSPQVWVGLQQATVVSASRGSCCTGIDPSFEVPQGVAGWDVIQFVVPDGVTGCHVPVAVQTGNTVSNFAERAFDEAERLGSMAALVRCSCQQICLGIIQFVQRGHHVRLIGRHGRAGKESRVACAWL